MQRLTIISGLKQEGKTRELVDSYVVSFLKKAVTEEGEEFNCRYSIKPIFITASSKNPINDYINSINDITKDFIESIDGIENNIKVLKTESHKFYNEVKEKGELFNIMTSNIKECDCIFYLDLMDGVVTIDELLEFMDSFPSDISSNSCDIVATKLRTIK